MSRLFDYYAEVGGYDNLVIVPGRGVCGILRMAFTTGLFIGLDYLGYYGRYCYHTKAEAVEALKNWDGQGDPGGEWIKYKGAGGERPRIPDPLEQENK